MPSDYLINELEPGDLIVCYNNKVFVSVINDTILPSCYHVNNVSVVLQVRPSSIDSTLLFVDVLCKNQKHTIRLPIKSFELTFRKLAVEE